MINLTEGDRGNLIAKLTKAPIRIGYEGSNQFLKNAFTDQVKKNAGKEYLDELQKFNIH